MLAVTTAQRHMPHQVETICGFAYIFGSLGLSIYYLFTNFNASGAHSYLVDMTNVQLTTMSDSATLDLFAPSMALQKDYSHFYNPIPVSSAYARSILYTKRTDFAVILQALRYPTNQLLNQFTQYCWLDFNRTWETAHTDARQARCDARYTANVAVYWEAYLRNVKWDLFQSAYGGPSGSFTVTIANAILKNGTGQAFLDHVSACNGNVPVADELAYWTSNGLTYFQTQYQNFYDVGIVDTVEVVTALGQAQELTLKRAKTFSRDSGWTTINMNWGVGNDLYLSQAFGYSIIRSNPTNVRYLALCTDPVMIANGNCAPTYDQIYGYTHRMPLVNITHATLGQYNSIDMFVQSVPRHLVKFVTTVRSLVVSQTLLVESFYQAMTNIQTPTLLDPAPVAWTSNPNLLFMGGDPTCPSRTPRLFVQ
ncbi:Aste57867_512 [Aphanomyces stellatus]|uniref:Aste57867_512 protein n=1 Tax=Aphanomyces stellatus TaxID=120398 RepID=A0A485K3T2_9STRA|nr:hypothetical protein As57867_000511 [Aphanomyces stellatus]VFT77737.1 Aste57867_512 [Aphanomyces stellatus]